ncbi:uncharacterized protein [Pyrus communis]|uniref:uncharacterized protein n=1 Tax=Pyrus communis TaxID=23211 RepID=UPI0035BF0145
MKKSGGSGSGSRTRRCLTANFLETRLQFPVASSPANQPSPKSPIFNTSSRRKRAVDAAGGGASASVAAALMESPKSNALASIPDLKHLASSRLRDLKLHVDRSHCEILKDFDSSQSRFHKRFKIQSQACQQVLDEADKEYKKMTQRITESREAMASSWQMHRPLLLGLAKHQSLSFQSFEKQIDALCSRYGISTN